MNTTATYSFACERCMRTTRNASACDDCGFNGSENVKDDNPFELKAGSCIKLSNGDFWLILKVLGDVFLQEGFDGRWGTQHGGAGKEASVIVWDGKFASKRSVEEITKIAIEILEPDDSKITEAFETINQNYQI